jgi:pyruvate kinase
MAHSDLCCRNFRFVRSDLAGPKLRTGEVELGARVVKWKPHCDEFGHVTALAALDCVWLFPQDSYETASAAADACLPVPRDWLTNVGTDRT